jgi:hypothetical protein
MQWVAVQFTRALPWPDMLHAYGVLCRIGVCRAELESALERGVPELKSRLKASGTHRQALSRGTSII